MTSTCVFLVRHGVTASNAAGRYMGRSAEGLSNEGRWQARQLALRLASRSFAALYASPLRRARETAEIIAQPHALPVVAVPEFTELDLRRWEGLTAAEIEERDTADWRLWCTEPSLLRIEGIETLDNVRQRVRKGLRSLLRRHDGERIVLVTHDGIIRAAVLEALELPSTHYRSIPVDNTGLTALEATPTRTYLRALNDTGHLGDAVHAAVSGPADR